MTTSTLILSEFKADIEDWNSMLNEYSFSLLLMELRMRKIESNTVKLLRSSHLQDI